MIKVNLLPVRAAKKKETAVQQFVIVGVVLSIVAVIVVSMFVIKKMQVAATLEDISTANAKITELKTKIGKLEELKSLKEQVKKKLDVLNQLRKNKTGPAQRLASLSDRTPDKLWLTGYSESGSEVKISGIAFSEELIADYMKLLESSTDYMSVELVVSEQAEINGSKLKKFEISMKLEAVVPVTLPNPASVPSNSQPAQATQGKNK